MTIYELSENQLEELAQDVLCAIFDDCLDSSPSYGELAAARDLVSDSLLVAFYGDTDFSDDDFFCTAWEACA